MQMSVQADIDQAENKEKTNDQTVSHKKRTRGGSRRTFGLHFKKRGPTAKKGGCPARGKFEPAKTVLRPIEKLYQDEGKESISRVQGLIIGRRTQRLGGKSTTSLKVFEKRRLTYFGGKIL